MATKVAIVGSALSSRDLAPYHDTSCEIWSASPSNKGALPRVTAWFELHAFWFLSSPRNQEWVPAYLQFLRTLPLVYMQEQNGLVPNALKFPKDELVAEFGSTPFTSSAAWMLAKAIYDGATEIGLYGLDMTAGSEYEYERPGFQQFIAIARQRGIIVTVPPQSDVDVAIPLYGYGDNHPIAVKMMAHAGELRGRIAGFDKRIAEIEAERGQIIVNRALLQGALETNINLRRTWFAWSGPDE